jgi:hypothetical protein
VPRGASTGHRFTHIYMSVDAGLVARFGVGAGFLIAGSSPARPTLNPSDGNVSSRYTLQALRPKTRSAGRAWLDRPCA